MKRMILALGLWLLGTAQVLAFDVDAGEVLRYNVYWGPLHVGHAQLEYVPQGAFGASKGYVITARAWDSSSFINLDDTWRVTGKHGAKAAAFTPVRYEAKQKENSYVADKVVNFDPKRRTINYANLHDPSDKAEPLPWNKGMRDVLSALYAWRADGAEALEKPMENEVITVKKPFVLSKAPAKLETVTMRGESVDVWRVDITGKTPGKDDAETWIVRLRNDATLAPVQITARTKFGNFRAVLEP